MNLSKELVTEVALELTKQNLHNDLLLLGGEHCAIKLIRLIRAMELKEKRDLKLEVKCSLHG